MSESFFQVQSLAAAAEGEGEEAVLDDTTVTTVPDPDVQIDDPDVQIDEVDGDVDVDVDTTPDGDGYADADPDADGSVGSSGMASSETQHTQTRFSFYNAQDFHPKSPDRPQKSSTQGNGNININGNSNSNININGNSKKKKKEASATSRFNFYNAEEVNHSSDEPNQQQQQQQQQQEEEEQQQQQHQHILRSLQEHEQQRSDILGESNSKSNSTTSRSRSRSLSQQGAPASSKSPSPGGDNSSVQSQTSNPYEDAIKDALDLLRKHRYSSGASSQVASPTGGAATATLPNADADISLVQLPHTKKYEAANENNGGDDGDEELDDYDDQEANELKLQLQNLVRHDSDDPIMQTRAWDTEVGGAMMASPTNTETSLGEVYQAEIEARRKQRQERMAKYANRLAELKQDGGATNAASADPTPTNNNSSSGGSSSSNNSQSNNHNNNPWTTIPQIRAASWEDMPSNRHSGNGDGGNAAPANMSSFLDASILSDAGALITEQTGSVSTLSRHEEEVQRGVERVLLAILERASSQGRATQSDSWQQGEEKKSALLEEHAATLVTRTKEQDDALVKAMSDLLGSATSGDQSTSSAMELLIRQNTQQHAGRTISDTEGMACDLTTQLKDLALNNSIESGGAESLENVFKDIDSMASAEDRCNVPEPVAENRGRDRSVKPDPRKTVTDKKIPYGSLAPLDSETIEKGLTDELDGLVHSTTSMGNSSDAIDEIVHKVREKRGLPQAARKANRDSHRVANGLDKSIDERSRRKVDDSKKKDAPEMRQYSSSGAADDDDEDEDDSSASHSGSSRSHESDTDGDSEGDSESGASDGNDDSYDDDDDDEDVDTEEDEDAHHEILNGVLGPLSKRAGGTTGVVLEADSLLGRKEVTSPSIFDSLTAAMSMVHSVVSNEDSLPPIKDRYTTEHDDDPEAEELMKTLCAHLLPFGVDQKSELLDQIPAWDESNPDEAGYRIIRLTRDQLRRIEKAFENMVTGLKKDSERNLAEANGSDEAFERDLLAAEELLDREENNLKATERALTSVDKVKDGSVFGGDMSDEDDCLVAFPGIRPTGKGEMGDLEYFNLPIIFKSHVTGFEASKDLFLEAGNIVAGQYLVQSELGTAAFSTAYKCVDLNSEGDDVDGHEEVCLKVIKNTKDFFDQSLDEIKILELLRQSGRCDEKSIVEMRTFFYHREHLVIVTELLRQNLFEFGKFIIDNDEEPYFTMPRLSYITKQMLTALDFVHNLGLVHSDVKPENILLSSYSRAQIKLIDFGSSCYLTDRQSSYIQSRSYRAPEVVLGLPYDGRIDIWSLGCVVAEMFTGEVTFQNDSIVSMLSRIEALCGPFPRHMIAQGRQSSSFFTKCGLLYEKVSSGQDGERKEGSSNGGESDGSDGDEDRGKPGHCDIFQPKTTTLSARLGYSPDLLKNYDSGKKMSNDVKRRAMFADFIRQLLTIDPETRPTAAEALKHPWIQYASSLSEDDVKYPSS
jgi:serine/threonine protein kinase